MVFMSVIIAIVTWILAGYNGMSWTLVIVLLVVAIYSFVTKKNRSRTSHLCCGRKSGGG